MGSLLLALLLASGGAEDSRPNILWITAEDMSPNLGCYGDPDARTPHIDQLARQGVRYTHAYATNPVCSPARSCLITGMYATSLGTQRLRSRFPVPEAVRGFPALLREAGYYCTNNVKTDYNVANEAAFIRDAWDESSAKAHWRSRPGGKPFFSVFNLMTSHQSRTSVWPWDEFEQKVAKQLDPEHRQSPKTVHVPPYYPDTPTVRRSIARYHDCVQAMDAEVGELLRQLDEDGLADETIVVFFSDHGMGMPRGKRLLHESGLHVPLVIRVPERFAHLAPGKAGSTTDRLVSFVDFAPSMLSLVGLPVPKRMQGVAFLGYAEGAPRQYVFGARDRVDEAFDVARGVSDGRWLYIRNYMPHRSWNQPERYSDNAPMRREITRLAAEGKLNVTQMGYAGPRRALVEFYDSQHDPHQIHNLADDPKYAFQVKRLRGELRRWMLETGDLGFLTEQEAWRRSGERTPIAMAGSDDYPLERLLEVADLVGRPEALSRQISLLEDDDPAIRYWAAVGLHAHPDLPKHGIEALRLALRDQSPSVRIEAAGALGRRDDRAALDVLREEMGSDDLDVVLHATRTAQLLGDHARPLLPRMRELLADAKPNQEKDDRWMFVTFSLEEAFEQM
ncbi:Arylsulfatase [Planctomycetes bacterium Pan216]|uniref:Arylsulfatase n=1 Tax=Kolteria novifilia TaxID=2527975 RepID=A0A518B368_9BACT|nr:Arylsulfatase [Planctomycetes bacterium Pan216]